MQLVQNHKAGGHAAAVERILSGAQRISIAVAFLKDGGAQLLSPLLEACLENGGAVEAFLGTDFGITEPRGLARLVALTKRYERFEVFLADARRDTFHPKVYVARIGDEVRCLVGSANLTSGAMASNHELSIDTSVGSGDSLAKDLDGTFAGFRASDRFQCLDDLVLEQYSLRHKEAERLRRKLEKGIEDALAGQFDLRLLDDYLRRYRASKSEGAALSERRADRRRALAVQRAIAALGNGKLTKASKSAFAEHLSNLMSSKGDYEHLWHSGDIHRRGSEALKYPAEMIKLFMEGERAARLPAGEGYEKLRRLALDIPGVGVNMITEILCTYKPERYAVFNGNTSGALAAIGIAAPRGPTVGSLSADRYARLCATIDALRVRIGGADFTDADAFLNWLYFETKSAKNK